MRGQYDRSGQRVDVYRRDADAVLRAVRRVFRSWIAAGVEEPTLVKNYDYGYGSTIPYAILWEGGPYDWACTFTSGGVNEDEASLAAEVGARPKVYEPIEVENVFLEPIRGWALGIYADR